MANRPAPIFANETTAAALLDLKPVEFRALVAAGYLPRGYPIAPNVIRWNTEDLRNLASGKLARPGEGLEL